jgi:hypothetical protein
VYKDDTWFYILVLAGLFVIFRVVGMVLLTKKAKTVF